MSETLNPAWALMERLQRRKGDAYAGGAAEEEAYQDWCAMLAWVADVERRLPQPPMPPRARPLDANTAAIEKAVDALAAQKVAEQMADDWARDDSERCIHDASRPCSCESAVHCPARPDGQPAAEWVDTGAALKPPVVAQLVATNACRCGGTYRPRGDGMACDGCGRYYRTAGPEARPQSAWIAPEQTAAYPPDPDPVADLRELLAEVCAAQPMPAMIYQRAQRLVQSLRACRPHQVMVFRPGQVLP